MVRDLATEGDRALAAASRLADRCRAAGVRVPEFPDEGLRSYSDLRALLRAVDGKRPRTRVARWWCEATSWYVRSVLVALGRWPTELAIADLRMARRVTLWRVNLRRAARRAAIVRA